VSLQRSGLDYTIVRPGGLRNNSGVVCSNFTLLDGWQEVEIVVCTAEYHLVSVLCVKEMRVVCHRIINLSKSPIMWQELEIVRKGKRIPK